MNTQPLTSHRATLTKTPLRNENLAQPETATKDYIFSHFCLSSNEISTPPANISELTKQCWANLSKLVLKHQLTPPNAMPLHSEKFLHQLIYGVTQEQQNPFFKYKNKIPLLSQRGQMLWAKIKDADDNLSLNCRVSLTNLLGALCIKNHGEINLQLLARQFQKYFVQHHNQLLEFQSTQEASNWSRILEAADPGEKSAGSATAQLNAEFHEKIAAGGVKSGSLDFLENYEMPNQLLKSGGGILEIREQFPQAPAKNSLESLELLLEMESSPELPKAISHEIIEEDELAFLKEQFSETASATSERDPEESFSVVNPNLTTSFEKYEPEPAKLEESKVEIIEEQLEITEHIDEKILSFNFKAPAHLEDDLKTTSKLKQLLENPHSYSLDQRNRFFKDTPLNLLFERLNKCSPQFSGDLTLVKLKNKLLHNYQQQLQAHQLWLTKFIPSTSELEQLSVAKQSSYRAIQEDNPSELYLDLVKAHLKQPAQIPLDLPSYLSEHKYQAELALLALP